MKLLCAIKNINANVTNKSLYELYLFLKLYKQMSSTEMKIVHEKFMLYYNHNFCAVQI